MVKCHEIFEPVPDNCSSVKLLPISEFSLGDFLNFFSYFIQHCFICRPSDSTVPSLPTDAGIEPRTVPTIVHWQPDTL